MFFNNLRNVMSDIRDIQADENNPNDCSKEPHDLTHAVDGLRYFAISRILYKEDKAPVRDREEDDRHEEDYDEAMTGGDLDMSYLGI